MTQEMICRGLPSYRGFVKAKAQQTKNVCEMYMTA